MTTATEIKRLTGSTKYEAFTAMTMVELEGYTTDYDNKLVISDEDGGEYPIHFFRNGDEVIAVSDLFYGETGATLQGSRGNWYKVEYETVTLDD